MQFREIVEILKDVPYTAPREGKILYDFLSRGSAQNILELGFAHGTSTCYMAAALEENGSGRVVTIDRTRAKEHKPNIFDLLSRTGLDNYITPIFTEISYNWELMKIIESL